jgi:hypothetical protein
VGSGAIAVEQHYCDGIFTECAHNIERNLILFGENIGRHCRDQIHCVRADDLSEMAVIPIH